MALSFGRALSRSWLSRSLVRRSRNRMGYRRFRATIQATRAYIRGHTGLILSIRSYRPYQS